MELKRGVPMSDIKIEKASLEDMSRIQDLYTTLTGKRSDISNMIEMFSTFQNNDDYYFMVVKLNGYVIATGVGIVFRSLANNCKSYFVIDNIVVDKDYQHHGIGTILLKRLHEIAISNNCCMSYLVADSNNIHACLFYRKLGYTDEVIGFQKTLLNNNL